MEVKWYLDLYLILAVLLPSDRYVVSGVVPLLPVWESVLLHSKSVIFLEQPLNINLRSYRVVYLPENSFKIQNWLGLKHSTATNYSSPHPKAHWHQSGLHRCKVAPFLLLFERCFPEPQIHLNGLCSALYPLQKHFQKHHQH